MSENLAKLKKELGELKCADCGTWVAPTFLNINKIRVRGWRCPKCGMEILYEADAEPLLVLNKLKRGVSAKLGKVGNSLVVRVPKEFVNFFNLEKGGKVLLKAQDKKKIAIEVG